MVDVVELLRGRELAGRDLSEVGKGAAGIAEQDRERTGGAVQDDRVEVTVLVEVGELDLARVLPDGVEVDT